MLTDLLDPSDRQLGDLLAGSDAGAANSSGVRDHCRHRPLVRYVKLRVVPAPEMPTVFSPPLWVIDPDMHNGTCDALSWCMPGSLTSGFRWSRWRGKHSRHSRCMCNPQFYVSAKRPITMSWQKVLSSLLTLCVCVCVVCVYALCVCVCVWGGGGGDDWYALSAVWRHGYDALGMLDTHGLTSQNI